MKRCMQHKHCLLFLLCCTGPFSLPGQGVWNVNGNFVVPGQFLGSTNFGVLELRVNGMPGLRLEPDPRPNGIAASLIGVSTNNLIEQPGSGGNALVGCGWIGGPIILHSNTMGA